MRTRIRIIWSGRFFSIWSWNFDFHWRREFFHQLKDYEVLFFFYQRDVFISEIPLCWSLPMSWRFAHTRRTFELVTGRCWTASIPVTATCVTSLNTSYLRILLTPCVYVQLVIFTLNNLHFLIRLQIYGLSNRRTSCSLWGTNWIFIYMLLVAVIFSCTLGCATKRASRIH